MTGPYIYIYIYSHPQTDFFVLSELFSVARHVGRSKPGAKPIQLYVRLGFRPLGQQAYHVWPRELLRYLFNNIYIYIYKTSTNECPWYGNKISDHGAPALVECGVDLLYHYFQTHSDPSGSTLLTPIYGLNRTVWPFKWVQTNDWYRFISVELQYLEPFNYVQTNH